MPSMEYRLFAWAIENQAPLVCRYNGLERHFYPIILGHSDGEEAALVWQYGGQTSGGKLRKAAWKCFRLNNVENPEIGSGQWQAGASHQQAQSCVKQVDYDANPESPYGPMRRMGDMHGVKII